MNPLVIGSGLAGLLAGNMLIKHKPKLIEQQSALPHNHNAVLRFRSSVVGDVLGIPFRRVNMIKTSVPWTNPVADALAYSYKNSSTYRSDRSITTGMVSEERFIAPTDLVAQMFSPLKESTTFNLAFTKEMNLRDHGLVISTIPMPALMRILQYPLRDAVSFTASPGTNVRATIPDCDAYVSLMVPNPSYPFSRISITGDELIIECVNRELQNHELKGVTETALRLLGIADKHVHAVHASAIIHPSKYAKINPINEHQRREFLHWATTNHGIYSLGRFATWRPKLLLDDLIQDVRKIVFWSSGDNYERNKHR